MKVKVTREYEIDWPGTPAQFVRFINEELRLRHDTGLDSLDLGDAVFAATQLYDQGDITAYVDMSDAMSTVSYTGAPEEDFKAAVLDHDGAGNYRLFDTSTQQATTPLHPYGGTCPNCDEALTRVGDEYWGDTDEGMCPAQPGELHQPGLR